MGEPSFYERTESTAVMADYQQAKKDLDTAMEEWESLTVELEEYEV